MKRMSALSVAVLAAFGLIVAGCGNDESGTRLTIFAAASLQGSFDELAEAFTGAHPDIDVAPIVYDGSQALAQQIVEGADVDVIAFASQKSLGPVVEAKKSDAGQVFATNTLQIAVAPGNPKRITGLTDLTKNGVSTVLCAPEVPCGSASQTLLKDAGVTVTPVSEETSVTAVLTRVRNGEADAGLVYTTDVTGAKGAVVGVTPANADVAINRYPIAVATDAKLPEEARWFVDFVRSAAGQAILRKHGFGAP